jgi:hypothetical protein
MNCRKREAQVETTKEPDIEPIDRFYLLVGKCIKAWATVEGQLYDICAALLKSDAALVSVVFYRTPAIGARIDLVNDLLVVRFPKTKIDNQWLDPTVIKEWKAIKKQINDLLPQRNSLAHHPTKVIFSNTEPSKWEFIVSIESSPSAEELLRGRPLERVTQTQLQPHLDQVNAITVSFDQFISGPFAQAQP